MNKKTVKLCLGIIVLCLAIVLGYVLTHRSEKRQPTEAEISAYAAYTLNWQEMTGMDGSDMDIILSLCTFAQEKTIGGNVYETYTSDSLGEYLPDFGEIMELARRDNLLYIQYTTPEGDMITLGYDENGLCEKSVYDLSEDTLFYETRDTVEVWTRFRNGFQWGK